MIPNKYETNYKSPNNYTLLVNCFTPSVGRYLELFYTLQVYNTVQYEKRARKTIDTIDSDTSLWFRLETYHFSLCLRLFWCHEPRAGVPSNQHVVFNDGVNCIDKSHLREWKLRLVIRLE